MPGPIRNIQLTLTFWVLGVVLGALLAAFGFGLPFLTGALWSAVACGVVAAAWLAASLTTRVRNAFSGKRRGRRKGSARRTQSAKRTSQKSGRRDGLARDVARMARLERRANSIATKEIRAHAKTLARKRAQLVSANDYGAVDDRAWRRERDVFIDTVILARFKDDQREQLRARADLRGAWRGKIDAVASIEQKKRADVGSGALDFRPGMDGFEYEAFCAQLLSSGGWKVSNKGDSGDQGVDLIARKRDMTVAIQCKRYRGSVGNGAVQEIVAGKATVPGATYAAVVTNAQYTRSAKELARANGVFLLHHDDLPTLDATLAQGPLLTAA